MNEGRKGDKRRPPRWDSYPLGIAAPVVPRWNAGVRYWPVNLMLGVWVALFVGLVFPFGFVGGPLVTAAVGATYLVLLVLAPMRRRLVPREVGRAASPVPLRLWMLGLLLVTIGSATYPLGAPAERGPYNETLQILIEGSIALLVYSGVWCLRIAPAWEQWRRRPRKKRGKGLPVTPS